MSRYLNRLGPIAKAVVPAAIVALLPILAMVSTFIGTGAFSVWAFRVALATVFTTIVQGGITYLVPNTPGSPPQPDGPREPIVWVPPIQWDKIPD